MIKHSPWFQPRKRNIYKIRSIPVVETMGLCFNMIVEILSKSGFKMNQMQLKLCAKSVLSVKSVGKKHLKLFFSEKTSFKNLLKNNHLKRFSLF